MYVINVTHQFSCPSYEGLVYGLSSATEKMVFAWKWLIRTLSFHFTNYSYELIKSIPGPEFVFSSWSRRQTILDQFFIIQWTLHVNATIKAMVQFFLSFHWYLEANFQSRNFHIPSIFWEKGPSALHVIINNIVIFQTLKPALCFLISS